MYPLYILDKIRKGQQAVKKQVLTSEELKREIEAWRSGRFLCLAPVTR